MLHGIITALVTPFKNGKLDEQAYRQHIEWQINEGVHALLPCGTTGESATLSHSEHEDVIRICIEQANKRIPVLAGAGSNNTSEAISLTKFAKDIGADACLHITPYYNKPSQEGLFQHFKAINDAVDIPVYAYNVPGRTGTNMLPSTIARIYKELHNVKGIKEAAGNIVQISDMIEQCDKDFRLLTGDDFNFLPALSLGARGVISVASNVVPRMYADLYDAFNNKDLEKARTIHFSLQELNRTLFIDVNPVPTKTALSLMNRMSPELRLPLTALSKEHTNVLKNALKSVNISV